MKVGDEDSENNDEDSRFSDCNISVNGIGIFESVEAEREECEARDDEDEDA